MDDPGLAWPAWKFGMKRDDLFTSLHDKYNTFSLTIQDPEAFHHDVYEISRDADDSDEFHRLMADRQRQRIREMNESLESLAVEIIANPKLMATEQWHHALQLFRTKSFDSIVRFFASYLPDEYLDRHDARSTSSSFSEADTTYTQSTKASSVDDAPCPPFLDDDFFPHGPAMTDEPCSLDCDVHSDPAVDAPLSPPESETMQPEESVASPTDVESHGYSHTNPPSPSMSFSGSESGAFGSDLVRRSYIHDDETSQSDDGDSAVTSLSDSVESRSSFDPIDHKDLPPSPVEAEDEDDEFPTAQYPDEYLDFSDFHNDTLESDTPTPRQETPATSYVQYKSMAARRLPSPHRRSPSPSPKSHPPSHREGNPLWDIRRSPDEALSKVQKPLSDTRRRLNGRRRMD